MFGLEPKKVAFAYTHDATKLKKYMFSLESKHPRRQPEDETSTGQPPEAPEETLPAPAAAPPAPVKPSRYLVCEEARPKIMRSPKNVIKAYL